MNDIYDSTLQVQEFYLLSNKQNMKMYLHDYTIVWRLPIVSNEI